MNAQRGDGRDLGAAAFVQFLGWPRSGTTLVMSLLNAHPGVLISHECDVSALVVAGLNRDQILARMAAARARFEEAGSQWFGYDYQIASAAAGENEPVLLGDKKAGGTAEMFALHPDIFQRTELTLDVSLRLLVVVRNPFDVIASISRNLPGDVPDWFRIGSDPLASAIDWYSLMSTVVQRAVDVSPCPIHFLSFTDLITDPADTLAMVLRFLGVLESTEEMDPLYAAMVRSKVFPTARRPSLSIDWTPEQAHRVRELIKSTPFLRSSLGEAL